MRLRREADGMAATQVMLIYLSFFLILIYVLGLVTGFLRNGSEVLVVVRNALPVAGVAILTELLRYGLVKRIGGSWKLLAAVVATFSAMTIAVGWSSYSLSSPLLVFEMVGRLVLGSMAVNLMLTFVAWKSDFRPTVIYALVMALYPVVTPIVPDLGPFLYSVAAVVLPMLLFMRFNMLFEAKRGLPQRGSRAAGWLATVPILAVLGVVVVMVSGIFRYWAMAVGSGSMTPNINKGDVVIIDKDYGGMARIEAGMVLAFRQDGRVVVHRVMEIKKAEGGYKVQTKGDFNADKDAWLVREEDVVGVVNLRVPLVGWPTVWITEAL
jgi:signal peptidase